MKNFWVLALVALAACVSLSCGSSGRRLQSITISASNVGNQIQLVATGNFSAAPLTVTPLPVNWSLAPPPPNYSLSSEPFSIQCSVGGYAGPFVAMAPENPNAPTTGSISGTKMVSQSTSCSSVNQ